ncbi:MAG TPA: hypothetical protein VG269_19365 [Tepidisphaeraceae bacterium]|jgi:HEAT repeat protein|nr:hypothetical protein [Tepidisphaeraceae bacterium]
MFGWFIRHPKPQCGGRSAGAWFNGYWYRRPWYCPAEVAKALATVGEGGSVVDPVAVLLGNGNEAARCVAALHLEYGRRSEGEAALAAALQDESDSVRRAAAAVLCEIGSLAALTAVVTGSRHGRTTAARRLQSFKEAAAPAVPGLMLLLRNSRTPWRTRYIAQDALVAIGAAAVPAIKEVFLRGPPHAREYAAHALKEIGPPPELTEAVDKAVAGYRQAAEQVAAKHGE